MRKSLFPRFRLAAHVWVVVLALLVAPLAAAQKQSAQAEGWEMRVCADPNNLPYSNKAEEGFENRIAQILADQLHAKLTYVWYPQRNMLIQHVLRAGQCDVIMGVSDGLPQLQTTLPYYRSSYVFVYREDARFKVASFDDPELKKLRIGVQITGGGEPPPNTALGHRGMAANLEGYPITGNYDTHAPVLPIVIAVADGDVDVAVVWGPIAGYFAKQQRVPLRVVPVQPQFEPPSLSMVFAISIGLRQGERDFSDLMNRALVERWDDIQGVLKEYGVPLQPLTKPKLSLEEN